MSSSDTLLNDEGFYDIILEDYNEQEVKVFVQCLMSKNIGSEDTLRCLAAIAVHMNLSHEIYDETWIDDEDKEQSYPTSDFQEWINEGVDMILYSKDTQRWIQFLLDSLLEDEAYELLHVLDLENNYNLLK